jgi:hypothetical protein
MAVVVTASSLRHSEEIQIVCTSNLLCLVALVGSLSMEEYVKSDEFKAIVAEEVKQKLAQAAGVCTKFKFACISNCVGLSVCSLTWAESRRRQENIAAIAKPPDGAKQRLDATLNLVRKKRYAALQSSNDPLVVQVLNCSLSEHRGSGSKDLQRPSKQNRTTSPRRPTREQ